MRLYALLALILLPASALAEEPAELVQAVSLFERGDYAQAAIALAGVAASSTLPEEKKGVARLYLAATYHTLGESALAYAELAELARRNPGQKIDPVLFLPDFVALSKKAAEQVSVEKKLAAPAATKKEAPAAAVAAPAPAPSPSRPLRIASLVCFGAAAGTLGTGIFFGVRARQGRSLLETTAGQTQPVSSFSQRDAFDLDRRVASDARAANGLMVTGAVLAAGGATLYWLSLPAGSSAVTLAPSSRGITLAGMLP